MKIEKAKIFFSLRTLIPKVKTVIAPLKMRASASCQRAFFTPGPSGALSNSVVTSVTLRV